MESVGQPNEKHERIVLMSLDSWNRGFGLETGPDKDSGEVCFDFTHLLPSTVDPALFHAVPGPHSRSCGVSEVPARETGNAHDDEAD